MARSVTRDMEGLRGWMMVYPGMRGRMITCTLEGMHAMTIQTHVHVLVESGRLPVRKELRLGPHTAYDMHKQGGINAY